jgi:hypothetical protein
VAGDGKWRDGKWWRTSEEEVDKDKDKEDKDRHRH